MKGFRNTVLVLAFTGALLSICSAKDYYISQNGAGAKTGSSCTDAFAASFFNSSANWGSGGNQIGPDTTAHLCGTFTGSAGSSPLLTFQGSGTSGHPITVLWEAGATLTAPYWGVSGAITAAGKSWIILDGGTNGVITSTASGTASNKCTGGTNCAPAGIYFDTVSNSEIKNLTISNIYVHICAGPLSSCTDDDGNQFSKGIFWLGGSNATIDHNTISDVFAAIDYTYPGSTTTSNLSMHHNTIFNDNWGIQIGSGGTNGIVSGLSVFNNTIHDWNSWGTDNNNYHHDGIFVFTAVPGQSMTGVQIYNNILYGGLDAISGFIYVEDDTAGRNIINSYIFNNLIYITAVPSSGVFAGIFDWSTGAFIYNNTIVYPQNGGNGGTAYLLYGTGAVLRNNIFSTCAYGFVVNAAPSNILSSNFNDIYNCAAFGAYQGHFQDTLSQWQSFTGFDANSISANPNLNAGSNPPYQLTSTSSPAYRTGTNLTSSCGVAPALCFDATGAARPPSGNWDMGAYSFNSDPPPGPPEGLAAVVN